MRLLRSSLAIACTLVLTGCGERAAEGAPLGAPMTVEVDATDAAHGKLRTHVTIPAHAGELGLVYPKWIPGEHGPTGPINDVVDIHVRAGGKELAWKRDSVDVHQIKVNVPEGATKVEVDFEMLRYGGGEYSGASAASPTMVDVVWNHLVMYPKGAKVADIAVDASVKLPKGWSFGTSLKKKSAGESLAFERTTLEMLVDSPVVAGQHVARYDLGTERGVPHGVTVVGDTAEAVKAPPELVAQWKKLIVEAHALFGARHYDTYEFLVVANDHVPSFGLEHHQSSEDYVLVKAVSDKDTARTYASLLPHEYVHSWNGKHRRPKGLATPDYQTPMQGDLLWVYEGLTNYLGIVLAARSGLASAEDARQELAGEIGVVSGPGRKWRALGDTATSVQLLNVASGSGHSIRRGLDYYPEGSLIWLEADVIIRQKTNGQKSLDDFCRAFHGGKDTPAGVRPYDLDEVLKTLNGVVANDWKEFFAARVDRVRPEVPLAGVENGGYKVAFTDKQPEYTKLREGAFKYSSFADSLGFGFDKDDTVRDVLDGSPASKAGLTPNSKLVAVDHRRFSSEGLESALARAKADRKPIELLVEKDEVFSTVAVDYHDGMRWRVIERVEGKPDLLGAILAPKIK